MDKRYMHEYHHFDGDHTVIFNIIEVNEQRREITLAVSDQGRLTQTAYDLKGDMNDPYFEYGIFGECKIPVNEFEKIEEE